MRSIWLGEQVTVMIWTIGCRQNATFVTVRGDAIDRFDVRVQERAHEHEHCAVTVQGV